VGRSSYGPQSIAAQVNSNVVNVTLDAVFLGFAAPPAAICGSVVVGPLPPGKYLVNFFLRSVGIPVPVTTLVQSTELIVSEGGAPIPATSEYALIAIGSIIAAAAWQTFRHRTK